MILMALKPQKVLRRLKLRLVEISVWYMAKPTNGEGTTSHQVLLRHTEVVSSR